MSGKMTKALVLPEVMSEAAKDALSLMLWQTGSLAEAYRKAGFSIPRKAEEEQAFVLYRALRHALKHGVDWRKHAQDELNEMRRAALKDNGADS